MDLGAFAGGISGGLDHGQQLADAYRKRQQQILESQLLQKQMQAGGGQGAPPAQVPMPGASPMPATGGNAIGAPGFASIRPQQAGAPQPMPPGGMGAAPPPGPPAGAAPPPGPPAGGGMPPMGGGGPPGMPSPMPAPGGDPPAPQATPVNPPGGGGPAPSIGMSDTTTDPQAILKSVALDIYRADPTRKWQRSELLDAVNDRIAQMKGVDPSARIAAQAQIAGAKESLAYWESQTKAGQTDRKLDQGDEKILETARQHDLMDKQKKAALDGALQRAKLAATSREKVQAMQDATRMQAEALIQGGADARAANMIDFRKQALDAGLNEKEWQAQLGAQLKEQGMSDNFATKLFGAQSVNAEPGKAPSPPARPQVSGAPPPPKVGSGKPVPKSTMDQWAQVPAANKAAAKKHLADQGYDVSGLR